MTTTALWAVESQPYALHAASPAPPPLARHHREESELRRAADSPWALVNPSIRRRG